MGPVTDGPAAGRRHDLRMPALGAAAWMGGIAADRLGPHAGWALAAVVLAAAWLWWRGRNAAGGSRRSLVVAALLMAAAVLCGAQLRHDAVRASPLQAWAAERSTADLVATVVSDPRKVEGQWGERVVVHLRVSEVVARGTRVDLGARVVLIGDPAWADVVLGERVVDRKSVV